MWWWVAVNHADSGWPVFHPESRAGRGGMARDRGRRWGQRGYHGPLARKSARRHSGERGYKKTGMTGYHHLSKARMILCSGGRFGDPNLDSGQRIRDAVDKEQVIPAKDSQPRPHVHVGDAASTQPSWSRLSRPSTTSLVGPKPRYLEKKSWMVGQAASELAAYSCVTQTGAPLSGAPRPTMTIENSGNRPVAHGTIRP